MSVAEGWLVLDVDDTLVDTFAVGWRKCVRTAELLGLPAPDPGRFARLYGTRPFRDCVAALHPGVNLDRYAAAYDSLAGAYPTRPIGHVAAAVAAAGAAGLRVGVLTNGPGDKTLRKLAAAGLDPGALGFVCHADNSPCGKPNPYAFTRLVDDFGVVPARAWYVSDQPADWRACARLGFGAAGLVSGSPHVPAGGDVPQLIAARLEDVVATLTALEDLTVPRIRPDAPLAGVGLDAGFTLIEHVRTPEQVLAGALSARRTAVPAGMPGTGAEPWRAAPVGVPGGSPAAPAPASWAADGSIHAALTRYYTELAGPQHDPDLVGAVLARYTAPDNWRARAGADALLARLHRTGRPVGVLSNWQSGLPEVLVRAGLRGPLDAVVASAACGAAKPAAAAFAALARALDVPLAGLLHAGDDPAVDGAGALAAGCRALIIRDPLLSPAVTRALEVVAACR